MLDIDIERVEAGRLGDARNFDTAHEPHRHRGDDLIARKLVLDGVAQDFADLDGHGRAGAILLKVHGRKTAMNHSTEFKSIRYEVSPAEWQARLDLAACYRLVDSYGMTDLIYNHITARIPGTEHLLINLYGLLYKEITASSSGEDRCRG